ncbi:MAG: hypothetical protein Q4C67_10215 [Deinococcus sp.]|nr:hypothetical protein [Deinococcus sp.]
MTYVFVALLLVIAVIAALRVRRVMRDRAAAGSEATSFAGAVPLQAPVPPVQAPSQEVFGAAPGVSWDELEETAVRPQVDADLLRTARASVSRDIPDDVLEEMLFKATPQQTAQLLAGVAPGVMADLTADHGQGVHFKGQARAEDLAALNNLGSAVDDLDIWDFAADQPSNIKA